MTETLRLNTLCDDGRYYQIEHETDRAYLLGSKAYNDGAVVEHRTKWVPKSQVKLSDDRSTIELPNWLADKPWESQTIVRQW